MGVGVGVCKWCACVCVCVHAMCVHTRARAISVCSCMHCRFVLVCVHMVWQVFTCFLRISTNETLAQFSTFQWFSSIECDYIYSHYIKPPSILLQ